MATKKKVSKKKVAKKKAVKKPSFASCAERERWEQAHQEK